MNLFQRFHLVFVLCLSCAFVLPISAAQPDERDRQVLETLMQHLLADSKFNMTRVSRKGSTVVLDVRNPEKTGFLMSHQIRSEIGSRTLPNDAENDMRRRNTPTDSDPGKYDSAAAFYTNLTFGAGIVVTNLADLQKGRRSFTAFEDSQPKARGHLVAYLPGYSKDGTRAVVRAGVGPSEHGAMLTAVLVKRDEKWSVEWYYVARFA